MTATHTYVRNKFANVRKEISDSVSIWVVIFKFKSIGLLLYIASKPISLTCIHLPEDHYEYLSIKIKPKQTNGAMIINQSDLIIYSTQ